MKNILKAIPLALFLVYFFISKSWEFKNKLIAVGFISLISVFVIYNQYKKENDKEKKVTKISILLIFIATSLAIGSIYYNS